MHLIFFFKILKLKCIQLLREEGKNFRYIYECPLIMNISEKIADILT